MSGLFGGDNSAQVEMQRRQLELQKKQQERLDAQERDQAGALLARQRASAFGGFRALMSGGSLGTQPAGGTQPTLGSGT